MGDLIDRQDAVNVLCDNCDHAQAICPHYPCKQYTKIEQLPSAQPTQPNTPNTLEALDCISRQKAIDVIRFECGEWTGLAKTIENKINELPSAQPERKNG